MKTGKCTREACLWASLRVKARASQLKQWIQKRANVINSSGKAQTLEKSTALIDHQTPRETPRWYILITCKEIWKNKTFTEHGPWVKSLEGVVALNVIFSGHSWLHFMKQVAGRQGFWHSHFTIHPLGLYCFEFGLKLWHNLAESRGRSSNALLSHIHVVIKLATGQNRLTLHSVYILHFRNTTCNHMLELTRIGRGKIWHVQFRARP